MLAQLPADEYTLTVDAAAEVGACGGDSLDHFVLDQLLSGLRRTADSGPR
jgi:hypothetical protein